MLRKPVSVLALVASMAAAATYQAGWPAQEAAPVSLDAAARPAAADPQIGVAVTEWNRLRQSDRLPFADYAAFLTAHPGWPGAVAMQRAAERAIRPDMEQPAQVIALFDRTPPLTGAGRLAFADALLASGRTDAARAAARNAWTGGVLSSTDEARLLGRYGTALQPGDQDRRMERLLWDRATVTASAQLARVSPARRPLYAARLAMQMRSTDAVALSEAIRPAADRDPGFQLDRAMWLRDMMRGAEARLYLAQPVTYDGLPFDAEKWMEGQLLFARAAAADNQWSLAYGIAARLDAALPRGTDLKQRTAGERDDYTSLAWIGGTSALKAGRPADAQSLFVRYANASKTPFSQSKGQYWAGRAATANRDTAGANGWFAQAATHYDQFYGQLAAERIGRPLPVPPMAGAVVTATDPAFDRDELVRAARWLGLNGNWQDQTQFVRAIAQRTGDGRNHADAIRLSTGIARPDLAVMVGRQARIDGTTDYVRAGFPQVALPSSLDPQFVMVHAIARQESQFDREAISPVGARGLMQLMGPTARQTAGKIGLPYDQPRLTSDPAYNMQLGAAYFAELLNRYAGNHVLAVAAYNAGPGNVNKFIRANGDPRMPGVDVIDWIEAIPLSETRGYVQHVLENAVVYELMNPSRARSGGGNRLSGYLGRPRAG